MYKKSDFKYIDNDDLYFSTLKGDGIYCWNNGTDVDPTDVTGKQQCPVFMNIKTEENFLLKRILLPQYMEQYEAAILNPPKTDRVICPVDLISLHEHNVSMNFCEHLFGMAAENGMEDQVCDHAFLFPYKSYGVAKTVKDELAEVKELCWKDPRVQKVMVHILEAFQKLNAEHYWCYDFDFSHMYIRNDQSIIFEFSNLIIEQTDESVKKKLRKQVQMIKGTYPYEFAEPALISGKVKMADANMQNYSLAAMLFYLMIGRYPYDGALLAGLTDNNIVEHEHRFEVYHKNPIFIFDENENNANRLGFFAADQKSIDLWNELPEKIQSCFRNVLNKRNAQRNAPFTNPTPGWWLEHLELLQ